MSREQISVAYLTVVTGGKDGEDKPSFYLKKSLAGDTNGHKCSIVA